MNNFSPRELETLDPIWQLICEETSFRQINAKVVGQLRNACDRQSTSIVEYLRFKFLQEMEGKQTPFQTVIEGKKCLFCQTELTGKQTKFCSENHKVQFYNQEKK